MMVRLRILRGYFSRTSLSLERTARPFISAI